MTEPKDDNAKTHRLMRYADGEAGPAESVEVLREMAGDGDAARAAAHQQQLRDAVARVMAADAPSTPQALRDRISRLAAETPAADQGPIGHIGFAHRWAPAIAAAVLVAVGLGVFFASSRLSAQGPRYLTIGGMHAVAGLIEPEQLVRYVNRHETCAANPNALHREDMPAQLERVPDAVLEHMHAENASMPGLDLSSWGYAFAGAGRCGIPGDRSVHLVYRAVDNPGAPALSLWLCPDDGRYDIPEGAVCRIIDQSVEHPMAVWRSAGILYFLVGDAPEPVDQISTRLSHRY